MNRSPDLSASALALACLLGCAAPVHSQDPPVVPVEVALAERAAFAPVLWAPGDVFAREDARVANELAGRVVEVAEVGERLRRGDPVARIDHAMLALREEEEQARLARIQAQLDYATAQEARLAELVQRASISGAQLDEARSQRRVLEQDLVAARSALSQLRLQLRQASVRAPFDGVVAERFAQPGEYLAVGQPVIRLVNTRALEVRARAPVSLAASLQAGGRVAVRAEGMLLEQSLRAVVPVGDDASRQLEVRVALDGVELPIGTPVQVALPTAEAREAIGVQRDALVLRKDGTYVMRVAGDGTVERVPVETGAVQNGLVEVRGAVQAGDRLVVRGGERVQPGQEVSVAGAHTDAAAAATAAATSAAAAGLGGG